MKEFATSADMLAHYRDLRKRLRGPAPSPVKPPSPPHEAVRSLVLRRAVLAALAERQGVPLKQYEVGFQQRSERQAVLDRKTFAWIIRKRAPGIGTNKIAFWTGYRDASTVLHHIRQIDELNETNPSFAAILKRLGARIDELLK